MKTPRGWRPVRESPLFVALLKHLGSDCATTGSGKASLVFQSGEDTVRVTVEVVTPTQHSWEFIDTRGEVLPPHIHGYSALPDGVGGRQP